MNTTLQYELAALHADLPAVETRARAAQAMLDNHKELIAEAEAELAALETQAGKQPQT